MSLKPSPSETKRALESTAALAKAKRLAPKARDYVEAFGPAGLKGDPRGKWEYKFPTSDDPEKQRRINETVYDMQQPYRNAEIERSGERNANVESVTLKDRNGATRVVAASLAERTARKHSLVEAPRRRPTHVWRNNRWERVRPNLFKPEGGD